MTGSFGRGGGRAGSGGGRAGRESSSESPDQIIARKISSPPSPAPASPAPASPASAQPETPAIASDNRPPLALRPARQGEPAPVIVVRGLPDDPGTQQYHNVKLEIGMKSYHGAQMIPGKLRDIADVVRRYFLKPPVCRSAAMAHSPNSRTEVLPTLLPVLWTSKWRCFVLPRGTEFLGKGRLRCLETIPFSYLWLYPSLP